MKCKERDPESCEPLVPQHKIRAEGVPEDRASAHEAEIHGMSWHLEERGAHASCRTRRVVDTLVMGKERHAAGNIP